MKRTPVVLEKSTVPGLFHPFLEKAAVFDSSCSANAKVYFLDKGQGFYLKCAGAGSLKKEAEMTRYFHKKRMSAEVIAYESSDKDWLLTTRIPGEDCLDSLYLSNPIRLCDTVAELLRMLHDSDFSGCSVNRTADYITNARKNYETGHYDTSLFPDNWGYRTPEEAWRVVEENGKYLKSDTLLHGDYCLPNILLQNWTFSGFIDLDSAGVGDRHIDLFWGIWSLQYNLKTNRYRDRFLDAYGTDSVNEDIFPVISAFEVFG